MPLVVGLGLLSLAAMSLDTSLGLRVVGCGEAAVTGLELLTGLAEPDTGLMAMVLSS